MVHFGGEVVARAYIQDAGRLWAQSANRERERKW